MKVMLERKRHKVNHKRIRRISRKIGIEAIHPKPKLTKQFSEHRKYPYLLRDLSIDRPDHLWCSDITYIRMKYGFVYLVAIMDWFSRYVLSFEVSTTLDKEFCIKALKIALSSSKPEIFNSDQEVQFTNDEFIACLKEKEIWISMDGRGRAHDNIFIERLWRTVKYEEVYLNEYETVKEAVSWFGWHFYFYNNERPHQTLEYKTPCEIYQNSHIKQILFILRIDLKLKMSTLLMLLFCLYNG